MRLWIDNRVRIQVTKENWPILKSIREDFIHHNPEYYKQKNMGIWPKVPQYLKTCRWDDANRTILSFPRGGLWAIVEQLRSRNLEFTLEDHRLNGCRVDFPISNNWQLRDYQEEAVRKILLFETCLIQGAAGSGKTEILLAAIAKIGLRSLVIVPDGRIFDQWVNRAETRLGLSKKEIGTVGNRNKLKLGQFLTIATQQAAWRRPKELAKEFGFVGLDECHHAAARTYMTLLDAFPAKYRVGISATIKRQDARHFLTHDLFGKIAYQITRKNLEQRGYLQEVECVVIPTNFQYDYLNKKELRKICEKIDVNFWELNSADRQKLAKRFKLQRKHFPEYCTAVSEDPDRNALIAKYVMEEVNKGNRCLVFTTRREHCELWKQALEARGYEVAIFWGCSTVAEENRMRADLVRLQKGEIKIGVGTVIDEALDLPAVEAGFICQRVAQNPGKLEQQAGRLARKFQGKKGARIYYFWDKEIPEFKNDLELLKQQFSKLKVVQNVI